jgi:hypothetical protein
VVVFKALDPAVLPQRWVKQRPTTTWRSFNGLINTDARAAPIALWIWQRRMGTRKW